MGSSMLACGLLLAAVYAGKTIHTSGALALLPRF